MICAFCGRALQPLAHGEAITGRICLGLEAWWHAACAREDEALAAYDAADRVSAPEAWARLVALLRARGPGRVEELR